MTCAVRSHRYRYHYHYHYHHYYYHYLSVFNYIIRLLHFPFFFSFLTLAFKFHLIWSKLLKHLESNLF